MTDLTPVGLSQDGKTLVLVSARGAEFRVRVDHRLRAALQGDNARVGQLEMTMESTLRPRDIQSRIRAGESTEQVAAAAQTSVERIMPYAGPVLAERAHVAQSAQASSVRRRGGESGSARTLGEAALQHLREAGLHDEDVTWDAWRREDGRWTLVAEYTVADTPHRAELVYDVRGRYVTAENDDARLLTGEQRLETAAAPARPGGRRLAAVPSQDELPLGDDAIEIVHGEADPDLEPTVEVAAAAPELAEPEQTAEQRVDQVVDQEPEQPAAPVRRKGRSSVPSWDEIMFGGGRPE